MIESNDPQSLYKYCVLPAILQPHLHHTPSHHTTLYPFRHRRPISPYHLVHLHAPLSSTPPPHTYTPLYPTTHHHHNVFLLIIVVRMEAPQRIPAALPPHVNGYNPPIPHHPRRHLRNLPCLRLHTPARQPDRCTQLPSHHHNPRLRTLLPPRLFDAVVVQPQHAPNVSGKAVRAQSAHGEISGKG